MSFLAPAIGAGASILSGLFGGRGNAQSETKMQKTQRQLVDSLLQSLKGNGPYSGLFSTDENAFQKSFVEPAQARFRNQIAPQIQQQYIASGQQGSTGLDDQLLRAGVDLDSMLNQQYYQSQQDAKNRQQNTIGNILGAGSGAPNRPSIGQDVMSSLGGYLSSPAFANQTADIFKPKTTAPNYIPQRRGYTQDYTPFNQGGY